MRTIAVFLLAALAASAQTPAAKGKAAAPAKGAVPRAADGKPDLTGVWQGGSNIRGTWDDANSGLGVGGSGTNPNVQPVLSSADRGNREGAQDDCLRRM